MVKFGIESCIHPENEETEWESMSIATFTVNSQFYSIFSQYNIYAYLFRI